MDKEVSVTEIERLKN